MPESKDTPNLAAIDRQMAIDTGGVAFPCAHEGGQKGMDLRDYFAAKAMQGITSWSDATPEAARAFQRAADKAGRSILEHLAVNAYRIADAMIAARKPRQHGNERPCFCCGRLPSEGHNPACDHHPSHEGRR